LFGVSTGAFDHLQDAIYTIWDCKHNCKNILISLELQYGAVWGLLRCYLSTTVVDMTWGVWSNLKHSSRMQLRRIQTRNLEPAVTYLKGTFTNQCTTNPGYEVAIVCHARSELTDLLTKGQDSEDICRIKYFKLIRIKNIFYWRRYAYVLYIIFYLQDYFF
jgi:hypothetical protein